MIFVQVPFQLVPNLSNSELFDFPFIVILSNPVLLSNTLFPIVVTVLGITTVVNPFLLNALLPIFFIFTYLISSGIFNSFPHISL